MYLFRLTSLNILKYTLHILSAQNYAFRRTLIVPHNTILTYNMKVFEHASIVIVLYGPKAL